MNHSDKFRIIRILELVLCIVRFIGIWSWVEHVKDRALEHVGLCSLLLSAAHH